MGPWQQAPPCSSAHPWMSQTHTPLPTTTQLKMEEADPSGLASAPHPHAQIIQRDRCVCPERILEDGQGQHWPQTAGV